MNRLAHLGFSLILAFGAACAEAPRAADDDDGGGSSGAGASTADSPGTTLTPADGGTLSDELGRVSLTVPGGAVADTVQLALSVDPATAETVAPIFVFSPADTTFALPATLRVSTANVTAPAGDELVLSRYADGVWISVADAQITGDNIEAPVTGLGSFSIIARTANEGPCEATCMSQPAATCCTTCGCDTETACQPVCGADIRWDCEIGCCFDGTQCVD